MSTSWSKPPDLPPSGLHYRVGRTDAALAAWKRTADVRRERWKEAQAHLDAQAAERRRRLTATIGGMGAGAAMVALVAVGILIGKRGSRPTADPKLEVADALTMAEAVLPEASLIPPLIPPNPPTTVNATAPFHPPATVPPATVSLALTVSEETLPLAVNPHLWRLGDYYGAEFEIQRSRVRVVFIDPNGLEWADTDDKRWCPKGLAGVPRTCRYARKLAPFVASGQQPAGTWLVRACDDIRSECVDLVQFEMAAPEPGDKNASVEVPASTEEDSDAT